MIDKIAKQKRVADSCLQRLLPIDPNAIVAGGAPRDWYFSKEASDIDLFLYHSVASTTCMKRMLEELGFEITEVKHGHNIPEWYKLNPNLNAVFETVVNSQKVQIMLMKDITFKSVIPEFPLSICKIWYKNGSIRTEKEFDVSVKLKAIFKTNSIYGEDHVYLKKILDKFPEYTYYNSFENLKTKIFNDSMKGL